MKDFLFLSIIFIIVTFFPILVKDARKRYAKSRKGVFNMIVYYMFIIFQSCYFFIFENYFYIKSLEFSFVFYLVPIFNLIFLMFWVVYLDRFFYIYLVQCDATQKNIFSFVYKMFFSLFLVYLFYISEIDFLLYSVSVFWAAWVISSGLVRFNNEKGI